MSQSEFAILIGVTQTTVSNYENGLREPSLDLVKLMAQVLETSVDDLLSE